MNTNKQKNARCENCRWFNPDPHYQGCAPPTAGECRAALPVAGPTHKRWPEVKIDDWCRVFTTKPETQ